MAASDGIRKRRTQITLDDELYQSLAAEAQIEGRSISSVIREALSQWLKPRRPRPIQESPFWALVGKYNSGQSGDRPISEHVDDYLYPRSDQRLDEDQNSQRPADHSGSTD